MATHGTDGPSGACTFDILVLQFVASGILPLQDVLEVLFRPMVFGDVRARFRISSFGWASSRFWRSLEFFPLQARLYSLCAFSILTMRVMWERFLGGYIFRSPFFLSFGFQQEPR